MAIGGDNGVVGDRDASAGRRLVAALTNWAISAGVVALALRTWGVTGWAFLLGPYVVFTLGTGFGAGIGELLTGLRIRDARTDRRLDPVRALVRTVIQLLFSYATSLIGWPLGLHIGFTLSAPLGVDPFSFALTIAIVVVGILPALTEALFVRARAVRAAPWDRVANSTVTRSSMRSPNARETIRT